MCFEVRFSFLDFLILSVRGAIICFHFMSDACSGRMTSRGFFFLHGYCTLLLCGDLTFCPPCCLALWCGTLIVLLVQQLLIILGSLLLYCGMGVSTVGFQTNVRLSFVDSVC